MFHNLLKRCHSFVIVSPMQRPTASLSMKSKSFILFIYLCVCAGPAASAHEHRDVGGKFMFMVGFVKEPAFAGENNGVDLRVTTLSGDKPVEGLQRTLHVTVLKKGNDNSIVLPLRPKYKEPGRYAGYFLPTDPGAYIFIFEGTVDGVTVKEKFESSNGKFSGVEEPVLFPGRK